MKELLKKAFEAGKDRQYNIEWQLGRGKPDFEEWYKEHESEALALHNVVGRSEQFTCSCGIPPAIRLCEGVQTCLKCGDKLSK